MTLNRKILFDMGIYMTIYGKVYRYTSHSAKKGAYPLKISLLTRKGKYTKEKAYPYFCWWYNGKVYKIAYATLIYALVIGGVPNTHTVVCLDGNLFNATVENMCLMRKEEARKYKYSKKGE